MILLIDNYDSFTYNLYHYLLEVGAEVEVVRHDAITCSEIEKKNPAGILLSPGPCTPNEAGICLELIEKFYNKYPILGVCLGHQSIGQVFGAKVVLGDKPMHAKVSDITHTGHALFADIPTTFKATRYHSLILEKETLPDDLSVIATSTDGVIQGVAHKKYPVFGVQFHPESIASEHGHTILKNFLKECQ